MNNKDVKSIVISVVIVTTTISTWSTGSFPVIAQEATSKTAYHVMKPTHEAHQLVPLVCNSPLNQIMYHMDVANQFEIACNSTQQPHQQLWDLTVYVKAPPQVLRNIEKVNYRAYPQFTGPNETNQIVFHNGTWSANITTQNNNFALKTSVLAGPKINAAVFFKGNQVRQYPPLQIILQCTAQACPIIFTVNPKLIGLNILKVDGLDESRNIVKIHVAWGDGSTSDAANFPLTHKYSKPGPYIVRIAATSNRGDCITTHTRHTN
jgi:hypothetical protein